MIVEPGKQRSGKLLGDFIMYCTENPDQRFWQALRNWSGQTFILAGDSVLDERGNLTVPEGLKDTFYWESING